MYIYNIKQKINHRKLKKFLKRKNSNSYLNNYLQEIDYHQK